MSKGFSLNLERMLASSPGKACLVIMTTMVAAGVMTLFLGLNLGLSHRFLILFPTIGLGLVSGISSRILLKKNLRFLQLSAAFIATILGLFFLAALTKGAFGLTTMGLKLSSSNYLTIGQLLLSLFTTFISVQAWNNRPYLGEKKDLNQSRKISKKTKERNLKIKTPVHKSGYVRKKKKHVWKPWASWHFRTDFNHWFNVLKIQDINLPDWIKRKTAQSTQRIRFSHHVDRRDSHKFTNSGQNLSIKLIGEEIHNCPYCLDAVNKNDPRGLKICPICKTWHHGDCWAEIGECQVPHRNN